MIYRKKDKEANFTIVDNGYLQDPSLSFKAKGILTYLLSLPDDWIVYYDEIIKHSIDGIKSFRSGIDELIRGSYIRRYPVRENGTIVRWETDIYEVKPGADDHKGDDEKLEVDGKDESSDSLPSTNPPSTYASKDSYNFKDYRAIGDAWSALGDRVVPVEKIVGDPYNMYHVLKLCSDHGYENLMRTIRNIGANKDYVHRPLRFEWFVKDENYRRFT